MANKKKHSYDADRFHGSVRGDTLPSIQIERSSLRISTEIPIVCRPYTSSFAMRTTEGIMRNFSVNGSYIETSYDFKPGEILVVRTVSYPPLPTSTPNEQWPRTFCLVEVKWVLKLPDKNERKFGIGLRYLDD